MLLDDLMPRYDVTERHRTLVHAPPARVYAAIGEADLLGGPMTRVLYALRVLPDALRGVVLRRPNPGAKLRPPSAVRLRDLERSGFHVVATAPPDELVLGVLGRFWTLSGERCTDVTDETLRAGPPAGLALAGWNFTVVSLSGGRSELRTETRVLCAPDVRRKFRLYWLLVRPGSGLIRREILGAIRRCAERPQRRLT